MDVQSPILCTSKYPRRNKEAKGHGNDEIDTCWWLPELAEALMEMKDTHLPPCKGVNLMDWELQFLCGLVNRD